MKENKKMLIVVIVLAIITILVTIVAIVENKNQAKKLEEFNKYLNSETNELIYFARDTCHYCQLMEEAKETLLDGPKVDYYYVDTDKVSENILDKMIDKLGLDEFGTPTLVIVKKGEVVKIQSGVFSSETNNVSELSSFLKENDIIGK